MRIVNTFSTLSKMDTRFWGPSGWRLLHLITFTYEPSRRTYVKEFFELLPFVLPCKFCRASLTDYMLADPIEASLGSRASLTRWLYRIHNMVNEKLRGQGLLHTPNPSFASVKKMYEERVRQGCQRTEFEGWDFLFSIAENHPLAPDMRKNTPMPDMPPEVSVSKDIRELNRWNLLTPEAKMPYYTKFWEAVGPALPFSEWREAWGACEARLALRMKQTRSKLLRELWKLRCCMEEELELINREKFESVCAKLEEHKSGCNKKWRAKTCRKRR
jgi:hypothetical protein